MANLVVRNLDKRIVDVLKQRAARHGRSAEAEHRVTLKEVLLPSNRKSSRPCRMWARMMTSSA